jgi:hypothetical protein
VVRPINSFFCKVIEFMLTTSPELVFHSAGVKKLICRRTSGFVTPSFEASQAARQVERLSKHHLSSRPPVRTGTTE